MFHLMACALVVVTAFLYTFFIYRYLQALMYIYNNCSQSYMEMTTLKFSQEVLQDIQYFWLQDLEVNYPILF